MKRIIALVMAISLVTLSARAQEYETPENEIAISTGYGTLPHLALDFFSFWENVFFGDNYSVDSYGSVSLMYLHNFNPHFAVGVSATYENIKYDNVNNKKSTIDYLSVLPTIRAYWFRHTGFGMYSRGGIGYSLYKNDGRVSKIVGLQLSPVSMEFGNRKVSGFVEFGYGFQGVINAGLKFGF